MYNKQTSANIDAEVQPSLLAHLVDYIEKGMLL